MPRIELETQIQADPARCFDLHTRSFGHTNERAVAGTTTGLIGLEEEVTWEGRHFGLRLRHSAKITAFDPPQHFRDEMTRGHFKFFRHDHYFAPANGGTRMLDVLEFRSPAGFVGRIVDFLVLHRYLKKLLQTRNAFIKSVAESGG